MSRVLVNFNWVQAHAACSIAQVFSELYLGAEEDVKTRNLIPNTGGYPAPAFRVQSNSDGDFFAVFENGNNAAMVKFQRGQGRIIITIQERQVVVTLGLNNDGECKLKINGDAKELEQWQVRRMVLEGLLFSPRID
jgi:hypothetical protein